MTRLKVNADNLPIVLLKIGRINIDLCNRNISDYE